MGHPVFTRTTRAQIEADLAAARRDNERLRREMSRLTRENGSLRVSANRSDQIVGDLIRARMLIFMVDGSVYDGLMLAADQRTLVFADVHRRASDATVAAAPGELYIDRTRVSYLQRVAADQPPRDV